MSKSSKITQIDSSFQKKRIIICRNCYQWKRDGFCTVYQEIIKAPDVEHLCNYFGEDSPERKIAQNEKGAQNESI